MASKAQGVWAIDIGTCSLKALRLRAVEGEIEVVGFDYLEHAKILSAPDANPSDKQAMIAATLRQFLSRNDVGKEEVAISIAGQNSFARFIKLPPVEPKKVPEIVQFEAIQQIPFDINEVEWDWQKMDIQNSPDAEVGIFAIKNELIAEIMDHFTRENLHVSCVQIAPMAMFNYVLYDRKEVSAEGRKATIILDIGAENSTLAICTRDTVWQRSIRIGGNSFTQAIADAFKLSFEKAEKLKRTAPMSKYMRQIYTAMKPVYTELSGELQRSLGFYGSSGPGRDQGFSAIIATGGGMKLQGLTKYLQQSLGIPVIKPDSFEKLKASGSVSAASFHENICDFGIVYGLGVQMLNQAKITVNLLPGKIARSMAWNRKAKLFAAAAAILVLVSLLALGRAFRDSTEYNAKATVRQDVQGILGRANEAIGKMDKIKSESQPLASQIQKQFDLFDYRNIIPLLNEQLVSCLPNEQNSPEQAGLFEAFNNGDVTAIRAVPRGERKQIFVTRVMIEYSADMQNASFPDPSKNAASSNMMGGMMGMYTPPPTQPMPMMGGFGGEFQQTETVAVEVPPAGFSVLIEGYTPYQKINELLDPTGVANDPSRWGIITRLENLGKLIKGTPFELFKKNDTTHFKVDYDVVITGSQRSSANQTKQPLGIGVEVDKRRVPEELDTPRNAPGMMRMGMGMGMEGGGYGAGMATPDRIVTEKVLVDPMTDEEISKTYDLITPQDVERNPEWSEKDIGRKKYDSYGKEKFIVRDTWFRIQAKFVWKGAPNVQVPLDSSLGGPGMGMPGMGGPGMGGQGFRRDEGL
jgi:type IV pilus assembly protein PilM